MSTVLNPSYATIAVIRTSIQNTLKADLPADVMVNAIAPLLTSVNQWSSQIPAVLESSGPLSCANLVFGIRKDLFISPLSSSSVMGIPLSNLPAPFQEFMNFIYKLIEAQKSERDKPVSKVRLYRSFKFLCLEFTTVFAFQPRRPGRVVKSKTYVDEDDNPETASVSDLVVEGANKSTDDSVRP
jgi:hypothetical protein